MPKKYFRQGKSQKYAGKKGKYLTGRKRAQLYGKKAGSMAYSAFKMARKLMDAVNTEYKYFDVTSSATYDHTGNLSILNTPAQGVTDTTRIGDSIKVQNLSLRGYIYPNAAAPAILRMMVIWDPQNKAATTSDVLQYVGSSYSVVSAKNYDKKFQTKVLLDKTFTCVANSERAIQDFDFVLPINQHTQYDAASTTINTGALKILIVSSLSVNLPTCGYLARVSYTDN